MSRHSAHSRAYHKAAREYLERCNARGVACWICGHPNVDQVDHDPPQSQLTDEQKLDPQFWRPSHGVNGCPTCERCCNQKRGTKRIDQVEQPRRYTSRPW